MAFTTSQRRNITELQSKNTVSIHNLCYLSFTLQNENENEPWTKEAIIIY